MEIVKVTYQGWAETFQSYSQKDKDLISSNFITNLFGSSDDYIEAFVYDLNDQILSIDYNYADYSPLDVNPQNRLFSSINIDPEKDVRSRGFDRGSVKIQYNFLKKLFGSSVTSRYWIKEISPSRLELKLSSQDLSNLDIQNGFAIFQNLISTRNYYSDFYINFGENSYIACVNAATSVEGEDTFLLIKLYEPLPFDFDVKDTLWLVGKMAESVSFNVDIQVPVEEVVQQNSLRGPNFNVAVNQKIGQTTQYYNYNTLFSTPISSSLQKIKSWYDDKAISINVDYSDFSNFVHFSSATERIKNFVYKLQLIEQYQQEIVQQKNIFGFGGVLNVKSSSIAALQENINGIVEKLDPYEYYLYFSSESFAWPKSTSTQPYALYSVTSSQASNWLGSESTPTTSTTASLLYSASYYDATNQNILTNITPSYIIDDESNAPYVTFLHMMGQYFDNIWLYYKDVSNRYNATNNPNTGVSKDLVADALRSFGVELYTNSNLSDNLYYTLFGINEDGSLLPPTGSEIINTSGDNLGFVTSSIATLAPDDIQKEIYKRIYHNLPYLLKSKGTRRGVKALISCFGIPEDLLTVKEFGGYSRDQEWGLDGIYDDKIETYTSTLLISSSVLRPDTSLQYFSNDKRSNSTVVEVGFSPADQINKHISQSLSFFEIDQVIGDYNNLYATEYQALNKIRDDYFNTYYTKRYNINAFVRFLKFFNNSVFKMVKDFVPARADLSTGIIIKSNILERSKYARHEPEMDISQNFSQSIDQLEISGSDPWEIKGSTETKGLYTSSIGYIQYTSSYGVEKYTGEFQNSEIVGTSLNSLGNQTEVSQILDYSFVDFNDPNTQYYITKSLDYLLHNVSSSVRSNRFLDLDYSYNLNTPVNYGLLTQSIKLSINGPDEEYYDNRESKTSPFAYMQDYGYYTNAWTVPRYYGSRTQSNLYTSYSLGDKSYGNTAAIDKQKYQYAYLVDIYTASFNLNGRANAQIKYMIDRDQNVLDLTKANTNIFVTQNVFKSGETVNVSLFDYDPRNPDVQFLTNNSDLRLYEGGWRYSPMLYKIEDGYLDYKIDPPIIETTTVTTAGSSGERASTFYTTSDFYFTVQHFNSPIGGWLYSTVCVTLENNTSVLNPSYKWPAVEETTVKVFLPKASGGGTVLPITIPAGQSAACRSINAPGDGTITSQWDNPYIYALSVVTSTTIPPSQTTKTTYIDSIKDYDADLFVNDANTIWLSVKQSDPNYYGRMTQINTSYPGMEIPVFPFVLSIGDMLKFRFPTNNTEYWPETEEYRVARVDFPTDADGNTRVAITLDRPINPAVIDSPSSIPGTISKYIINKHVPDETNVILRYNPKQNITQDGILFPQYIEQKTKDNSGNVIKSLKDQNLI